MIRASVNPFAEGFTRVTEQLEERIVVGLDAAAETAAATANAGAQIGSRGLALEIVGAHGAADGFSSGIKSRRTTDNPDRTTPIAWFFDQGTLGNRRRRLKQPRKESWTVNGRGGTHTAHRRAVKPGSGIKPQRFFLKARVAGRAALQAAIHRPR